MLATLNTKTAGNHTLDSRFCAPRHDCQSANLSMEVALSMYFGEATVDLGFAFAEAASGAAAPILVQCPLQASGGGIMNGYEKLSGYLDGLKWLKWISSGFKWC